MTNGKGAFKRKVMAIKINKSNTKRERAGYVRPIGQLVPGLTRHILGKRGIGQASIITDWAKIVGENLAAHSQPDRLAFPKGKRTGATLHIRVLGALATEMQHLEPMVVERINSHFGYRAVDRIRLIQAPFVNQTQNQKKRPKVQPKADPKDLAELHESLESVEDQEMRAVLERLGGAILRRKKATKSDH